MTELIKIQERGREQFVNGRELHRFLEVLTPYKKWFDRMCEYRFIENVDFIVMDKNVQDDIAFGGIRKITDHLMKISMAKEISMLQRNEKDKEVHFYFIKCK